MKDLLSLIFAVFVGVIAGTMPGVREKFPWGGAPSEAEIKAKEAALATPPPYMTPPPAAGSWMRDPNARNNALEKPAAPASSR